MTSASDTKATEFVVEKDDHLILILVRFLNEMLKEGTEHRRCDRSGPPDRFGGMLVSSRSSCC